MCRAESSSVPYPGRGWAQFRPRGIDDQCSSIAKPGINGICYTRVPPAVSSADEADMREVSHFLLELKNGSESRGDGICGIPHAAPANEIGAGSDLNPLPSSTPLSLDPLQSASPETKVSYHTLFFA